MGTLLTVMVYPTVVSIISVAHGTCKTIVFLVVFVLVLCVLLCIEYHAKYVFIY